MDSKPACLSGPDNTECQSVQTSRAQEIHTAPSRPSPPQYRGNNISARAPACGFRDKPASAPPWAQTLQRDECCPASLYIPEPDTETARAQDGTGQHCPDSGKPLRP